MRESLRLCRTSVVRRLYFCEHEGTHARYIGESVVAEIVAIRERGTRAPADRLRESRCGQPVR